MRKKLLIALPLASVMMFSGCATLFGGGSSQKRKNMQALSKLMVE